MINVAEFKHWRWLEEGGLWLENVDRAHLVLARGKLVPQKYVPALLADQFWPTAIWGKPTQMSPDPEDVDGVALVIEGQDGVLVDVVGSHHG